MSSAVTEERVRILRLVAEGKVSPEDGENLLEAMGIPVRDETRVMSSPFFGPEPPPPPSSPTSRKLVIQVSEEGEQRVNLRIPLGLMRAARRLIPRQAQEHLDEYDIKLDELLEGLSHVDGDGILLEIQDDDHQVRIAVE